MARGSSQNLIQANGEKTLKLAELAKDLPDEPCYATVLWWARKGRPDYRGTLIKLETIRRPRGLHSSFEAYERFIARLNGE